jgi:hypothetical protein
MIKNIPTPTNFNTGKHWPYYIYESMTGITLGPSASDVREQMAQPSYSSVMYCPIITDKRGGVSIHSMGRSDYGLNEYFRETTDGYKKMTTASVGGKLEPMFAPIQNPSNPALWSTSVSAGPKNAAYYYGNDSKTLGLFIHGNVRSISASEGASMDSAISNWNSFE